VPGALGDERQRASMRPIWESAIVLSLGLLCIALGVVASVSLSDLLPRSDTSGGLMPPVLPLWAIDLLCWGVSVPLALAVAALVGRLVRGRTWGSRLWVRAAMLVPLYCAIAAGLLWWMMQDPMAVPDGPQDAWWGTAAWLAAWGFGAPASLAAGLWVSAGRRPRVVQQWHQLDSRHLH
jgi:hypothetical protein